MLLRFLFRWVFSYAQGAIVQSYHKLPSFCISNIFCQHLQEIVFHLFIGCASFITKIIGFCSTKVSSASFMVVLLNDRGSEVKYCLWCQGDRSLCESQMSYFSPLFHSNKKYNHWSLQVATGDIFAAHPSFLSGFSFRLGIKFIYPSLEVGLKGCEVDTQDVVCVPKFRRRILAL